ncbi:MAG: P-loop NTPase [Acidobacteriota bacterium]
MNKSRLGRSFSDLIEIQGLLGDRRRLNPLPAYEKSPQIAKKIGITSGKGGTGKSILACNLSVYLSTMGKKVTILDADFGLANDHLLFGLYPDLNISHLLSGCVKAEDIKVRCSEGVWLIPGTSGIEWMADLSDISIYKVAQSLEGMERISDFMLIDTSAGISRHTLLLLLSCDEIIVVTNANATAITDAYAISKIIFQLKPTARIWIAVNRVKDDRESAAVFQKMNDVCQKFLKKQFLYLGCLQENELVNHSVNLKIPFFIKHPFSTASGEVARMGQTISANGGSSNVGFASEFIHVRIRKIIQGENMRT